jgi:hypothetical protein
LFIYIQTKFKFCPPDDAWARKNFERRGAAIMKNNLSKVRLARKRPSWISQKLWKTLNEHWKTPDYKKKRMQAKTNRASDRDGFGKPLHTCGSITTSQHGANLVKLIYFVYKNIFVYKFMGLCVYAANSILY